jgi:glucose/arabinose dehydrogenase
MSPLKRKAYFAFLFLTVFTTACDSDNSSSSAATSNAKETDCDAPQWVQGTEYATGHIVQNRGNQYRCTVTQWCSQDIPNWEPGNPHQPDQWPLAWEDLGICVSPEPEPEGNRLTLTFPDGPETGPTRPVGKKVATPRETLAGVLRCPNQPPIAITGTWGETKVIDDLSECDYQLILDANETVVPLNTPAMIKYTVAEGQQQTFTAAYRRQMDLGQLLPLPGLHVELFAQGVYQPRQMTLGGNVLYVGSSAIPSYVHNERIGDMIYALPLDPQSGKPMGIHVVASGLEEPHGVAYRDGDLFYSTTGKLLRIRGIDQVYDKQPVAERVLNFPGDDRLLPLPDQYRARIWHQKHPLFFNTLDPNDPDLYTAVGRPCENCKVPTEERYGTILKYNLNTGRSTILTKGVRNSVGFDWNPTTGQLWFSDNNRQGMSNPDEINRIGSARDDFGVPYVYGRDTLGFLPEEWENKDKPGVLPLIRGAILSDIPLDEIFVPAYTAPSHELASNSAPLGVKFWDGYPIGPDGSQKLLVAVHGGGQPEAPGVEVRMLTIVNNKIIHDVPFITRFVNDRAQADALCLTTYCIGRPTEFLALPDGSLLISDDVAGAIYRVSYSPEGLPATRISLQPQAAPNPSVAAEMVTGTLTDAEGRIRRFEAAWGAPELQLEGLPYGAYEIRLNNVTANWVPVERTRSVTIDSENSSVAVPLAYKPRPVDVEVSMTLTAPAKPDGETASHWNVQLKNMESQDIETIAVDWGSMHNAVLEYGNYRLLFPYSPQAIPEPSTQSLEIDESTADFETTTAYRQVEHLGQEMIANGDCKRCHQASFWDNPAMAYKYEAAGIERLIAKVKGMPVNDHCDDTCASQISNHLFNDVWEQYIGIEQEYGPRQLRLLTSREYINSVRDLFGVEIAATMLPEDRVTRSFKYQGEASIGIPQTEEVRRYYDAAIAVADQAEVGKLGFTQSRNDEFIRELGHRVFRRVLTPDELARYRTLYNRPEEEGGGERGVIAGMLLSPHFLYRSELGTPKAGEPGIFTLTPNELATALSFTFLGTTPNIELLNRAEAGGLDSPDKIAAEVEAMLATDEGLAQIQNFINYYARTRDGFSPSEKPVFGLTRELIDDMYSEQQAFVRDVFGRSDSTVAELFNPSFTYLNDSLATHYSISGVNWPDFRRVNLTGNNARRRGGLLNHGIVAVSVSSPTTTTLVQRGIFIRQQFYCQEFGNAEVNPSVPDQPAHPISMREWWDLSTGATIGNGSCWTCHKFFNDTGASMENFDPAARYRTEELAMNDPFNSNGVKVPIDAGGPFIDAIDGYWVEHIDDVRDIAQDITRNPEALGCLSESYFRQAFGSRSDPYTRKTIVRLREHLQNSGLLREFLIKMASSSAVKERRQPDQERHDD